MTFRRRLGGRGFWPALVALFLAACGAGGSGEGNPHSVNAAAARARSEPASLGLNPEPAATASFTLLAHASVEGISEDEVAYPSGNLVVRGFLFLPPGNGRLPGLLLNHGGVSGVSEDMKRRARDLARLGYAVFAPAYRGEGGSEGVVEVAKGEVDDVLAAAAILAGHPRVDAARMGLAGTSHGALVSVLAAAREPSRFACLAAASGVLDVVSWYRYLVENDFDVSDSLSVAVYGHGPEDKPEAFEIRNAMLIADRIEAPVLLQQGLRDNIVPPEQARGFHQKLLDAGKTEATLVEYPNLGHAFWGWTQEHHTAEEMDEAVAAWSDLTSFLARHLAPS